MNLDEFWALIERSARKTDLEERAEWLTKRLTKLPRADIEDFEIHLSRQRALADTWRLWGAADLICDGASDDSFWYFQAWLVGQGRAVFEQAVADPDSLAGVPFVRALAGTDPETWDDDDFPDWESLDYVASEAYEEKTSDDLDDVLEARGLLFPASPDPQDDRFDLHSPAERRHRYPRLAALFPQPSDDFDRRAISGG